MGMQEFKPKGYSPTSFVAPDFLVGIMTLFDPQVSSAQSAHVRNKKVCNGHISCRRRPSTLFWASEFSLVLRM